MIIFSPKTLNYYSMKSLALDYKRTSYSRIEGHLIGYVAWNQYIRLWEAPNDGRSPLGLMNLIFLKKL